MPILRDHQVLFIHIPKTAGTSINKALGINRGIGNFYYTDVEKKRFPVSLHHMTPRQLVSYRLISKAELVSTFTFTFVRNPFDRLVSEFHYRKGEFENQEEMIREFGRFLTVVKSIMRKRRWWIFDNHLRPQVHFTRLRFRQTLDFIGRYENLENDLLRLQEALPSNSLREPLSLSVEKKSKRLPYQEYYNKETRALVSKLYGRDLKKFDYAF